MEDTTITSVCHVGFGLCKDDFTIEQEEIATFKSTDDARAFIRMKTESVLNPYRKIYYADIPVQDGHGTIQVRYIYDRINNKFVEGSEIKGIKIPGYRVCATIYEYDEEYYDMEYSLCISYESALRCKEKYLADGADEVEIDEDIDVDVKEYFWNTADFFQGKQEINNQQELDMKSKGSDYMEPTILTIINSKREREGDEFPELAFIGYDENKAAEAALDALKYSCCRDFTRPASCIPGTEVEYFKAEGYEITGDLDEDMIANILGEDYMVTMSYKDRKFALKSDYMEYDEGGSFKSSQVMGCVSWDEVLGKDDNKEIDDYELER